MAEDAIRHADVLHLHGPWSIGNRQLAHLAAHREEIDAALTVPKLRETLAAPKPDISVYAPRITTVKVRPEKVRDVIGSGGKNIRQIVAETGVDYIAVGELPHSARVLDIGLDLRTI